MSYDEDDGFDNGFKMYDDEDEDTEFENPIDDYDLEDENPEKDG